ncbi:MAG: hypothetical protein LUG27_04065 [Clostridiales bacterium]|nr:hypothetical protein [Clostridiales bacterium]
MEELKKADVFETELDRQTRENMIRFARFMARMAGMMWIIFWCSSFPGSEEMRRMC